MRAMVDDDPWRDMTHPFRPRARWAALAAVGVVAASLTAFSPAQAAEPGDLAGSDLYLNPYSTTLEAAQSLSGQARDDAQLLGSIPSADWFTTGTPAEVQAAVDEVVSAADAAGEMPVLVAYNLPFRDCAQYSAGGAADTAAYAAGSTRSPPASAIARPPSSSSPTGSASSPGTRRSTTSPSGVSPPSSIPPPRPMTATRSSTTPSTRSGRWPRRPSTSTAPARAGSTSARSPTGC